MKRLAVVTWLAVWPLATFAEAVCTTPARTDCRLGTIPGAARMKMKGGNQSRMAFKWRHGQETLLADFGDPFVSTTYSVCIYDGTRTVVHNQNHVEPEPCSSTGPTPCWSVTKTGFRYRRIDSFDRATKVTLQAADEGKASIKYNSNSASVLANPGAMTPLPLVVQVQASDGACWEATFSTALLNNFTGDFRAISD